MTHHDDARLDDLLAQLGDGDSKDLFRRLLERGMQELIDAELTATIGAELHERTDTRTNQRNGARERGRCRRRRVISSCGSRSCVSGRSSRRLLEPRRRVDQALWAVIMTAYITGTSTRKVDDLVRALGCDSGVSKSTVSDLQGHRRRSRRVPHPTARSPRDAVRVLGRHLHQGPQQPSHRVPRRRGGDRGDDRRQP